MKRRIFDWLYRILAYLAPVDGHTPTLVRMKAVKPATFMIPVQRAYRPHISKDRERMKHHCDIPPWGTNGGTWYCPKCRAMRTYAPLTLPRAEATPPHYVPRIRGRHNGHLLYTSGQLVDTGKLIVPGRV